MRDELTAEDLRWLHSLDLAISICTRMKELGLSKNEVAERAGMKPSALSRIISGEQNLTLATIAKLEHALDVRFDAGFRYGTECKGLTYSAPQEQVRSRKFNNGANGRKQRAAKAGCAQPSPTRQNEGFGTSSQHREEVRQ